MSSPLSFRPKLHGRQSYGNLPTSQIQAINHKKASCGENVTHTMALACIRFRRHSYACIIRSTPTSDFANRTKHIRMDISESSSNGALIKPTTYPPTAGHLGLVGVSATMGVGVLNQQLQKEILHKDISLDVLDKGRLVDNDCVYRQMFVIRSYEVGFDKTASMETITNLFQETALNHAGMMDFVGDGMGTTYAMMRNRLIWIVTRMQIEMEQYPVWGDVVQIDSWVSGSGKNGMRRDFLLRDYSTEHVLGYATSNWAMMHEDTRRLSKMPEDVRAEISPYFLTRSVINEEERSSTKRIPLLDDSAPHRTIGLAPKVTDLDMNQHVNHVKYIKWLLESVPYSLLVSCEVSRMTLEYRRECGSSDTVESLAQPEEETKANSTSLPRCFTHLLRLQGDGAEVLRARTQWRPKRHNQCPYQYH